MCCAACWGEKLEDCGGVGLTGNKGEVNKVWEIVEKDAKDMARVAAALTTVRLEKKEKEFNQA